MNSLSSFKLALSTALSTALCAALIGCASSADTATPAVVRTPPPRNYEKTITDFLAFKIRNPQKNAEVSFGPPEPGACALDAYTTSSRGWVVPVAYFTRTGEATGNETIRINSKQYYFWFLGNTIAGVTPRIELCPGVGASFEAPPPAPGAMVTTASPVSATGEARREEADSAGSSKQGSPAGAKAASGQKAKATSSAKKSGTSSGNARPPVKKKSATSVSNTKPI